VPVEREQPIRILPRLALGVGAALLVWVLLPGVPREQTLLLALGACAPRIVELSLGWKSLAHGHEGGLTLHHRSGAPERIARQLRLVDGDYHVSVSARLRAPAGRDPGQSAGSERTETTRRVTLEGNTVTLRLPELCPSSHPPPQTSPPGR
jgi:hypothetical protein